MVPGGVSQARILLFEATVAGDLQILRQKENELLCLAQNLFFEARNQALDGVIAVAWTTENRRRSSAYPSTYCEIVHEVRGDDPLVCQFSWTCDDRSDFPSQEELAVWNRIVVIAWHFMSGKYPLDLTGGAMWYHAHYADPAWGRGATCRFIGDHCFYTRLAKPRSSAEVKISPPVPRPRPDAIQQLVLAQN
jgi:spore germination cell wall hydrolase CwlJ-like protein